MMDAGQKSTEKQLKILEGRIREEYKQAAEEVEEKLSNYLRDFERKDKANLELLRRGELSAAEYRRWREGQIAIGERWETLQRELAGTYTQANRVAMSMISDYTPEVYAEGMNFAMYQIEKGTNVYLGFTLYNTNTVRRLMQDNPQLLPSPRVNIPKDLRWNQRQLQSAITQSVLQGESTFKTAKRFRETVGESVTLRDIRNRDQKTAKQIAQELERKNRSAAVRNARTALTNAQNAGRLEEYQNAAKMGIDTRKVWMATLDNVTRESHVDLDGEVQDLDKPFSNGLMFPADAGGDPAEVYNCRCSMEPEFDRKATDWSNLEQRNNRLGDMTYEEWKGEKGREARQDYRRQKNREYRRQRKRRGE